MTLRIIDEIVEFARRVRVVIDKVEKRDRALAGQMREALVSIGLNAAEGARQRAGKGRSRFEDAMGSTDEVHCALRMADALGYVVIDAALLAEAQRIARVLNKLSR